ncbi:MAG: hypothetical protein LQ346_008606 [Caloplaca aetnensis]|nr:MAG: hypothetical protein LQ346_008606 [Caloplaca aetnensis]
MFSLDNGLASFLWRNYQAFFPTEVPKQSDAIRIGLLGASKIAPIAVISAAKTHPEVIVAAVAARDEKRATAYGKKYSIPIVFANYQALLDDTAIDAVYIALPAGLHYEWAIKALKAGKHVLLEKPSVSNAKEAAKLFRSPLLSGPDSPVLLEAFHYRFHPAWEKFISLIDPPNVVEAHSVQYCPKGIIPMYDMRCQFKLSGGCLMDFGTYNVSTLRQVFGTEPEECLEASFKGLPPGYDKEIDQAFTAKWKFPNGGIGSMHVDLIAEGGYAMPSLTSELPRFELPKLEVKHREGIVESDLPVDQEHVVQKTVIMYNFTGPFLYHRIDIQEKHTVRVKSTGEIVKSWVETSYVKQYAGTVGPDSWTSYRHGLEQFVNKVRKRPTRTFVSGEDSIKQMEMIDGAYEKAGLPIRPSLTNV